MSNLMGMLTTIQSYVWGPPTLLLLIGTGLYFTIKLRGLQITKFPRAVRAIFEKESGTGSGEGDVSAFATLCTTMAADIGTGSIVGVATALRIGGPGIVILDVDFSHTWYGDEIFRKSFSGKIPSDGRE